MMRAGSLWWSAPATASRYSASRLPSSMVVPCDMEVCPASTTSNTAGRCWADPAWLYVRRTMKPITDVHELFRYQRAIRNFTDEDVPDELVNRVLTAVIHGPSGSNTQPWHFIVIRDPRVKHAISEVYEEARAAAYGATP